MSFEVTVWEASLKECVEAIRAYCFDAKDKHSGRTANGDCRYCSCGHPGDAPAPCPVERLAYALAELTAAADKASGLYQQACELELHRGLGMVAGHLRKGDK